MATHAQNRGNGDLESRLVGIDTRWRRGMGTCGIERVEQISDEVQNMSCSSDLLLVLNSPIFSPRIASIQGR